MNGDKASINGIIDFLSWVPLIPMMMWSVILCLLPNVCMDLRPELRYCGNTSAVRKFLSYRPEIEIFIKIKFRRKFKMATAATIEHKIIHADKLAVFTCNDLIDERQIRFYVIDNWKTLTQGMDDSTILFIAGVHGLKTGKLGSNEKIQTMKNQVI